jgi:hypothetical protein
MSAKRPAKPKSPKITASSPVSSKNGRGKPRLQAERLDRPVAGPKNSLTDPLDRLMDRASLALIEMRYAEVHELASRALAQALARSDYERLARIALPLQEAHRQIRQLATDECPTHITGVIDALPRTPLTPGLYLVKPPLTAMDARQIREQHWATGVPIFLLTREPLTREGDWPIAAVGVGEQTVTARVKVRPPVPVRPSPTSPSKDEHDELPTREWFEATHEALGDWAIAKPPAGDPPAWRVMDFIEYLDALPEHEKLHQALAAEARKAMDTALPTMPRRRALMQNPFSF